MGTVKSNVIYINATFLCSDKLTGIARFAITLCSELKKKLGDRIVCIAPPNIGHPDIARSLGVVPVGSTTNRVLWEQIDLPLFLMKNGSPLLVSLGNTAPLLYRNQIVSILDIFYQKASAILQEKKNTYSWAVAQFFKLTTPQIIRRAKRIITISQFSKDDIVAYFKTNPEKIAIIYPSLSPKFLTITAPVGPNPYGKYILGVSAITPRKNFEGLIKAYMQANLEDVKLVIVGGSEMATKAYSLDAARGDNPNIIFTGHVDDQTLIDLYRNSLFFAYPSFWEGFGIPPLEAMACGCPTLVSNVTSLPEVCGDASLYVDPYSIDSICAGMVKLATNPELRHQLTIKGFSQINHYRQVDETAKLIELINRYA